jgi:hypothetical protein
MRRDSHDPLAGGYERLLQAPRDVPAILDRPHAIIVKASRPAHCGEMSGSVGLDLAVAARAARSRIHRSQGVRGLVRVRTDHDHVYRPFVRLDLRSGSSADKRH